MKNTIISMGLLMFIMSCRNAGDRDVSGTYTREWTFEEKNLNTGKLIGMAKFRDTIFIKRKSEGFEISNNRWRVNDYDDQGWHERSEGILHTYPVNYDPVDSTLVSKMPGMYNPIYISANGDLYKGDGRSWAWKKVK